MKFFFILFSLGISTLLYAEEKPKSIEIIFANDIFKSFDQPKDEKYFLVYKGTIVTKFSLSSIQEENTSISVGATEYWEKKVGPIAKQAKDTIRTIPLANLPELELKKDEIIHLYDSVLDKNVDFKVPEKLVISLIRNPSDVDVPFYKAFTVSTKDLKSTPKFNVIDEWGGYKDEYHVFDGLGYKGKRLSFVNGKIFKLDSSKMKYVDSKDIEFQMIKKTHINRYPKFASVKFKFTEVYEHDGYKIYIIPLGETIGGPAAHYYFKYGKDKYFEWKIHTDSSEDHKSEYLFGFGKMFKEANLSLIFNSTTSDTIRMVNLFDDKAELVQFDYDY